MRRLFDSALGRDLRLCPTCRRPFVAPREVLASHDDGNHVVELACANCGWWAIQLHGGVRLSALDEAQTRRAQQALAERLGLGQGDGGIDRESAANFALATR